MKEYCDCRIFKKVSHSIRIITEYKSEPSYDVVKVEKGYYIIDRLLEDEFSHDNHPIIPIKINFCPWCGKKLYISN